MLDHSKSVHKSWEPAGIERVNWENNRDDCYFLYIISFIFYAFYISSLRKCHNPVPRGTEYASKRPGKTREDPPGMYWKNTFYRINLISFAIFDTVQVKIWICLKYKYGEKKISWEF